MENTQITKRTTNTVLMNGVKMFNKMYTAQIEYTINPDSNPTHVNVSEVNSGWNVDFALRNLISVDNPQKTLPKTSNDAHMDFYVDRKTASFSKFRKPDDLAIYIYDFIAKEELCGTGIGSVFWKLMLHDIVGMYLKNKEITIYPDLFILGKLSDKDDKKNGHSSGPNVAGGWDSSIPFYLKIGRKSINILSEFGFSHARTLFVRSTNSGTEILYENNCDSSSPELTRPETENLRDELISMLRLDYKGNYVLFRLNR